MKRKIFSILFALVLVTGLSLVTAVPAIFAAEPAPVVGSMDLKEGSGNTAEWYSTDKYAGQYSVHLEVLSSSDAYLKIKLGELGIDLTVAEFASEFSWWVKQAGTGEKAPYAVICVSDGTNAEADKLHFEPLYDSSYTGVDTSSWYEFESANATMWELGWYDMEIKGAEGATNHSLQWFIDNNDDAGPGTGQGNDYDIKGTDKVTWIQIIMNSPGYDNSAVYVDDITIGDTTYSLEPLVMDTAHPYFYRTGESIVVTVGDCEQNDDPLRIDQILDVPVVSTTDAVGIEIDLDETGPNSGIFTGSFTITDAIPPGAGELTVVDGDTITVKYTGAWRSGAVLTVVTATVDAAKPVIEIVSPAASANITDIQPEIKATYTDVSGSGVDNATAVMTLNGDPVTPQTVTVDEIIYTPIASDNLTDGSYEVIVDVKDVAGNPAVTASWSFTVDTVAPVITSQVAEPAVVSPDVSSNITFTATVADATPGSGIATVIINLSPVGGTAALAMLDADADGIYTASENITESDEGDYDLTVTATDFVNKSVSANITLVVSSDTTAPVIASPAITYLYGLNSVPPGGTVTISANVTEAVGMGTVTAACTALVETPVSLTQGVGDVWSVTATVKAGMSGNYTVTIAAEDAKGNVAIPDTSLTLTVAAGVTGYELTLVEGWNLISLPVIPDESDITVVISATTLASENVTSVGIIRGYDPATGLFPSYTPSTGSGGLTEMVDGRGYWVFMETSDNLTITGRQWPVPPAVPPTYDVVVGWNLIGFKSLVNMIDYQAEPPEVGYLLNIAGTYPVVWIYDAVAGAYFNVKGEALGMEVGHGFWLWVTEAGTIVPSQ